jgi:uncharacterized membrane protein (UPF0182 family)
VGYEDKIAMEPTLEGALEKIFGDLFEDRGPEPDLSVAAREKARAGDSRTPGQRLVLDSADYVRIKNFFDRITASQKELDQTLAQYREDLQSMGEALDSAVVVVESESEGKKEQKEVSK